MNSSTIDQFEEALAAMLEAEFAAFWQEVKQKSGEGPLAAAVIANFAYSPANPPTLENDQPTTDKA